MTFLRNKQRENWLQFLCGTIISVEMFGDRLVKHSVCVEPLNQCPKSCSHIKAKRKLKRTFSFKALFIPSEIETDKRTGRKE